MIRRITTFYLPIILVLFLTLSAFALTKEERAWKEDILTLLSLVKRVGDYSEVVDLVEVAPALKEDPEIRKAFVTFAPPGATPPEWAKEEKETPPVRIEVPEKIATAETAEKLADAAEEEKKEEIAQRIIQEVTIQKETAPPVIREVPEKIAGAEAQKEQRRREKTVTAEAQKEKERRRVKEEEARRIAQEVAVQRKIQKREVAPPEIKMEEGIKEELGVRPTPLPKGAKVIRSTDVVSGVRAEMVEGKMKVTVTLSGERKYTVSERGRPPAIVIDIPHTINAVSPGRIMVNQGGVRMIEVTQHRATPFDETRVIIRLSRFKEYEVRSKENEIYVEFQE